MDKFILDSLSDIKGDISEVKTKIEVNHTLHKQNSKSLDTHIKRTNLLEDKVGILRRNQEWWSITGKILLVILPILGLVLKLTGVL